jgi:uncharacterized repeat protein (TIGR03943 family)
MVAARFIASLATAVVVGLLWARLGREAWMDRTRQRSVEGQTRRQSFTQTAQHDLLHAGGWLVLGAMTAATLQGVVPRSVLDGVPIARCWPWPPALGAFAASRQAIQPPPASQARPTGQVTANADPGLFPPLIPPGDGAAVPLTLTEYLARDYEEPHTLAGVRIRLVGFVTPQQPGRDGYLLTRFAIYCCAADATALKVAIHGNPVPRAPDTWLEVEGRWQQRTSGDPDQAASETPLLLAESIRVTKQPSPPYESGLPF